MGVVFNSADQGLFLKFHDGGHNAAGHDCRNSLGGVFNVVEGNAHGALCLRQGNELEGDFCNNAQRALGTREELGEVVAGHVLDALAASADNFARSQHDLHARDVALGGAIFDALQAACIGRHVAADGRKREAGGIRRVHEAVRGGGFFDVSGDCAGANNSHQGFRLHDDGIHALQRNNDGIVAFSNGVDAEAASLRACNHADFVLIAEADDLGNLFGSDGQGYQNGQKGRGGRPASVIGIANEVFLLGEHVFFTDK